MVADDGTVMLCEIAPLSDQLLQTYCTPAPVCGELVAMVCEEPAVQFSTSGAATAGPPSAETRRLAGLVVIVICATIGDKVTVAVEGVEVTGGPVGGVPLAVAESLTDPLFKSACVMV